MPVPLSNIGGTFLLSTLYKPFTFVSQPVSCTIPNPVLSRLGSVLAKLVFGELPISEHQEKVQTQISRNMHLSAGLQSRTSCMTLR